MSTIEQQHSHALCQNASTTTADSSVSTQQQGSLQYSLSQISIQEGWASGASGFSTKEIATNNNPIDQSVEWHPASPQLIGFHDCRSLAYAWGLGITTSNLNRATGASQAQSPCEDDGGDGKSNHLLASCPAFRNELGNEPIRKIALSRQYVSSQQFTEITTLKEGKENLQTVHREHTAAEICVTEDVSNVAAKQPKIVVESQDIGAYYYRHCFAGKSHVEFCGTHETFGPCVVSMVREESKDGNNQHIIYRLILRISDVLTLRVAVPEEALPSDNSQERNTRNLMRELLETVCPQIPFGCLRPVINIPKVEEILLKIDEQPIYTRYKVGVLYCRDGQSTEEQATIRSSNNVSKHTQMYNNENASSHFEDFLDFLGSRIRLKDFAGYKGGLDTRGDTTGLYSVYTEFHSSAQIMFHVSTMLPFTPNNKQQLARKRHIGNDMVTIIFQEASAGIFSPITIRSHFQHVFIVVRICNTDCYQVAISRAKDVPVFGPPLCSSAIYSKNDEFRNFLITKIINAENAVHRSPKFASMAARTRREALKELVENYSAAHHTNEGASRIATRLLGGGSVKRTREKAVPRPVLDESFRPAISWQIEVLDFSSNLRTAAVLGLSADNLVMLDVPSGLAIFATPTHSILGWILTPDNGLKIFFDHGDMLLLWCLSPDGSEREIGFLLKRLSAVTNGDEAKEVILRKTKQSDSFGFHIQEEGIVTECVMNQSAWRVGLRQGSRIVAIENEPLIRYNSESIAQLLAERTQLKVTMVSPGPDGNPRRGCEDSSCPAIRGQECQPILTPDTFTRQPYHQMFKALHDQPTDESNRGKEQHSRPLPPKISTSSESWSGPNTTLIAVPAERKKHSAPTFGNQTSGRQNFPSAKSSIDSSPLSKEVEQDFPSKDDLKDVTSLNPIFNRACSDDVSMTRSRDSTQALSQDLEETLLHSLNKQSTSSTSTMPVGADTEIQSKRKISTDGELARYQWWLQKTMEEKRELQAELEAVRIQLMAEQKSHENTRRQLQIVSEYCERFSIIPPPFDEEDEEL